MNKYYNLIYIDFFSQYVCLTKFKCFSFFRLANCLSAFRICQHFVVKYLGTNLPTMFEGNGITNEHEYNQNESQKSPISQNEFTHNLQKIHTISRH
jgi:hypothetical protein